MNVKAILRTVGIVCALGFGIGNTISSAYAGPDGLNQAAWIPGTDTYQFGYNSIPNIKISGAPADTDYTRSSMLFDGRAYRLYFFKAGSDDTLYQFSWNGDTYEYGFNSIPELTITGKPDDANANSFAMLHDGGAYRLYMLSQDKQSVYQFSWNGSEYEFGYNSIPNLAITGAPADADKSRWSMLHDGSAYRMYFGKSGTVDKLYQFSWNGESYDYGYNSIPVLTLDAIPANSDTSHFNMLHDGSAYRFYFLSPVKHIRLEDIYGEWFSESRGDLEHYISNQDNIEGRMSQSFKFHGDGTVDVLRITWADMPYYVPGTWSVIDDKLTVNYTDTVCADPRFKFDCKPKDFIDVYEILEISSSFMDLKRVR